MAVEIEIEEEIEYDVIGTKDFVFARVGDPVPLRPGDCSFDLQNPPKQPLAVSERHGMLFLAHSDGFLAVKTKDAIGLAKEIKEKGKGPCIQQASMVDVRIGRVSILAQSTDSSMLAAATGGVIRFYSVPSLLTKDLEPTSSCSLEKSGIVKDFKWQSNVDASFIILSSHGSLYHGHMGNCLDVVMDNVDAVDWSELGNFVAVARKNSLSILSPDFQEQIHISLTFQSWSDDSNPECSIRVDSIKCIRSDSIVVGCVRVYDDGREEGYLVQVLATRDHSFTKSSSKPVMFSFPDLFDEISDDVLPSDHGPYLLTSYLERWGLTLASNKKAIGQHLLLLQWSLDDNRKEAVSYEYRDEHHAPRIGLQESGDDNLVLGFGVDKISLYEKIKIKTEEEVKELSPYGIILCLTSEGKLTMFHIARVSEPSDLPQTTLPPADYYGAEEKLSTVISLDHELSMTFSGLKDSTEAVVSDYKLGHGNKEQPNLHIGTESKGIISSGNEGQSSAMSVPGLHSGRVSTTAQLPADSLKVGGPSFANTTRSGNHDLSLMFSKTSAASFIDSMSVKASVAKQEGLMVSEKGRDVGRDFSELTSGSGGNAVAGQGRSEGQAISPTSGGNAQSAFALHFQPVSTQRSSSGKAMHSRFQPVLDNSRINKSQMLVSEPELSKQFFNVKDTTKELDKLLSYIEQEGGFRDACTTFLESSVLALEHGLDDLSKTSQLCKNNAEVHFEKLQHLENKMLQVSTREAYMEGVVKQACNSQYWDMWNRQKLSPEFEMKRQHIFNMYQSLTDHLIELERHFNTLEISKFGENSRVRAGWKTSKSPNPSRQVPSMQSIYSSLNSQLAAAEKLSECLSKQMALLNINPPSAERSSVAKEVLESIGLHHETSSFQPPDIEGHCLTPDSVKRLPALAYSGVKGNHGDNISSVLNVLEPETVRRRRYSLDKSMANFEAQKTTVKRMSRKERFGVAAANDFTPSVVSSVSPMAGSPFTQQRSNEIPAFSFSQPSTSNFQSTAYLSGMEKKTTKEATGTQSSSPFKWATGLSGSSMTLKSESRPSQGVQRSTYQPLSSTVAPSPSLFSSLQTAAGNVGLYDASSTRTTQMGSQSISSLVESVPKFQETSKKSGTFMPNQTSLRLSSTVLPDSAASPSQTLNFMGYPSEPSNLKSSKDSLISYPAASIKQSADSSRNSSSYTDSKYISSFSTISSLQSAERKEDAALVDESKRKNELPEPLKASYLTTPGSTLSSASPALSPAPLLNLSNLGPSSLPVVLGGSSPMKTPDGATQQLASAASSTSSPSVSLFQSPKSSVLPTSMSTSDTPASSPASSLVNVLISGTEPSLTQKIVNEAQQLGDISAKSKPAMTQVPKSGELVGFSSQSTLISSTSGYMISDGSSSSEVPSVALPPLSASIVERDDGADLASSQEDEMEEEAPDAGNVFSLEALGGFGLGSAPASSSPKLNPFGGSFVTSTASSAPPLAASPGQLFRPASFNVPSAQPVQPQSSGAPSSGLGGGFTGFGQPSQIGSGQQALGSVLGAFGQSRQLGSGAQGFSFASGGFGGSGLSAAANSGGGFASAGGGFASPAAGGGFAAISSAGSGFAGAAAGGGFGAVVSGGGGFAAAATGGGFGAVASNSGGFGGGAAAGGGFAALASKGSGFAAAASGGGGFGGSNPGGGFTAGGFGAFSSTQGGGGFSAFGGNSAAGAGRPPAELLSQMRK